VADIGIPNPPNFAPILLHIFAIWMFFDLSKASEKPYFPAFPSFCHINLRIRKPMLYPLSYEGGTSVRNSAYTSARISSPSLRRPH
jgi:hypothetical protein